MKNKARNRKTTRPRDGAQDNKGVLNREEQSPRDGPSASLELIIFRALFAAFVVGFAVYGVYMFNISKTNVGFHTDDTLNKRSEEDIFVELDSDVEDPEDTAPINAAQHKEDTTERKKNERENKNNTEKEKSGSKIQSSLNTDSETMTSSTDKQNAPKTQTLKSKQPQSLPKDAKNLKSEAEKFKPTYLKKMSPKKIFADGRRLPPVELLAQKPNNSSVRVYLYDEFLSEQECDGLMKAHDGHVKESSKNNPLICFDTIETLRKHLKVARKKVKVTPADFLPGTFCVNETFSRQLSSWLKNNWSYSTAFYPGESRFSKIFEYRVKEATQLLPENGGKFQITSYPQGIGYKTHTDCIEENTDERDRMATILVYLQDVEDGGETKFPELGIWVKPRKGRALVWNNMNEDGKCEAMSIHNAAKVNIGHKYILQRWYYYKSFYSLGKRPPEPDIPARAPGTPRVNCDEYEKGSCRWYDEWNYEHIVEYRNQRINLK